MRSWPLALLLLVACGEASPAVSEDDVNAGSPGIADGPFVSSDATEAPDCPAGADLVYVLSQESDLYSFDPRGGTFTKVGAVTCPGTDDATPNSMAIDRKGVAWVNYADGRLFRVSTSNASCQKTRFEPNQAGFLKFGMAFATDGKSKSGERRETLYITGLDGSATIGKGLGTLDLATMTITMLGDFSNQLRGEGAELTGTGDGRLFGFFSTEPSATVASIDKSGGATSAARTLVGVETGGAWAFSFWGGDFWLYTAEGTSGSKVTRLQPNGSLSVVKAVAQTAGGAPFRIVGAGVSTCAPTTPLK